MSSMNNPPPGWGENPNRHLPWGAPPEHSAANPPAPPAAAPVPQQPEPNEPSTSPQPVKAATQRTSEPAEVPYVPPVPPLPAVPPVPKQPKSSSARTIGLVIGLCVLLGGASFFIGFKLANRGTGSAEASSVDSAVTEETEAENPTSASEETTALTEQNVVTDTQPSTAAAETATTLESNTATETSAAASTESSVSTEMNTAAATIATVQTTKATTTSKTTTTTKTTQKKEDVLTKEIGLMYNSMAIQCLCDDSSRNWITDENNDGIYEFKNITTGRADFLNTWSAKRNGSQYNLEYDCTDDYSYPSGQILNSYAATTKLFDLANKCGVRINDTEMLDLLLHIGTGLSSSYLWFTVCEVKLYESPSTDSRVIAKMQPYTLFDVYESFDYNGMKTDSNIGGYWFSIRTRINGEWEDGYVSIVPDKPIEGTDSAVFPVWFE